MKMENKTLRVKESLAKLLSKENISVLFSSQTSAKFDLERRILFCPLLEGMDNDIANLIIGHEVGHALNTDPSDLMLILKDKAFKIVPKNFKNHHNHSKQIWNVIEDAKIERLMKENYPGMVAIFAEGYRRLFSTEFDFFKVHSEAIDIDGLSTIDKLNLLAKVGPFSAVTLDPVEQGFFDRMMKIEKLVDIVELGREIWEYMVSKQQDVKPEPEDPDEPEKGDQKPGEGEESDNETDAEEQKGPPEMGQTQDNFDESLNKALRCNDQTTMKYFEIPKVINPYKVVIHWKDVLNSAEMANKIDSFLYGRFFKENQKVVADMAAMFAMRRSASNLAKQKFAKTGTLNMDSLVMHKFKDDIFQRIAVMPLQENHGLSLLVDWSGSMKNNVVQTVEQILLLVMFCRMIKIPYSVNLFTGLTGPNDHDDNLKYTMSILKKSTIPQSFEDDNTDVYRFPMHVTRLINVFSSEMTDKQFIAMANFMLGIRGHGEMSMMAFGATPMLTALIYNSYLIADIKKKYKLDKMHQVLITDGAPTDSIEAQVAKNPNQHLFLIDGETRKLYKFFSGQGSEFFKRWNETVVAEKNTPSSATMVFSQISKDRTGVSNYGFYVIPASLNDKLELIQTANMKSSLSHGDFWIELLRKYQAIAPKVTEIDKYIMADFAEKRILSFSNNIFDKFHIVAIVSTGDITQQQHFKQMADNDARKSNSHRNSNITKNFQALMKGRELKKVYCLDFIKAFA